MEPNVEIPCPSRFRSATQLAYLDTAAEGLPLDQARDALLEYLADKSSGSLGRDRIFAAEQQALGAVAALLGAQEENVAFVGNATEGLNLLSNSVR